MSICNRLEMETLRSRPIMPKNLPQHCNHLLILWYTQLWPLSIIMGPAFASATLTTWPIIPSF